MMHLFTRATRDVPFIAQLETTECGAACLAMVLAYHGQHVPLSEVREACAVSRDGVNAAALLSAAENFGFNAVGYSTDLDGLHDIPLPAILHWEFNHFVVLQKLETKIHSTAHYKGRAHILDPGRGKMSVSIEQLARCFTGVVLTFEPSVDFQSRASATSPLRKYHSLIRANRGALLQATGLSLLLQLVGLALPVGQQFLVDTILDQRQVSWLWVLAGALLFAILMQVMLRLARGWALSALQAILDLQLLGDFMRHAVRLPLSFFMQRNPGDLLQRMASNSELRSFLGTHIASAMLDTFLLVGYAALMLMYQWQLGLLVIAIGCARAVLQIVLRNLNRMAMATELAALSGAGSTLVETLGAVETIRAASAESFAIRRWSDRVVQRAVASKPRLNLDNAATQLTQLTNALGVAAVSALAGYQVITGGMSVGVFSAFMTLQALYLTPFNALIEAFGQWQQLGSHIARLDDVLETRPEDSGTADATSICGAISLRNVSFRYSSATPWILRDINIVIGAGEKIAIVGLSGSGKSTLARVLLGMLSPAEGAVYFDDKELRHYNLSKLRTRVGVVLQEIGTLNRSVTDNIRVANPGLSFASVKSAAQAACIDDVIEMLPNGFATILGDQGFQLSGGERQRLCIARAIANGPAVLVLDEATSALDSVVERRINANLAAMRCTRIVIAHRLDTIRDADRILVLDDGRIVQQGSFDALSAQPGLFKTMLHSMYPSSGMPAGDCNSPHAQAPMVTGCS